MRFETELKAEAIAAAVKAAVGVRPQIVDGGKYALLRFSPSGQVAARGWLESQFGKPPGDVRVDVGPVVNPVVLKKALPYLLGALALGVIIGKL